jgi:hypothetical protein
MPNYNPDRVGKFRDCYHMALEHDVLKNPGDYFGLTTEATHQQKIDYASALCTKMMTSVCTNGIHRINLSNSWKKAARALGLKPTYKAIDAYLKGE